MYKIRIIGDEVLRNVADEVKEFDENIKNLAKEMINIMHDADGIGLAAPQIGVSKQLLVIDISPIEKEAEPVIFVNPSILESSGDVILEEGCLSIPDIREEISRSEEILLKFQTIEGEEKIEKFEGWSARVLQHEIDHLNGILFIDHLSPLRQQLIMNTLTSA
jgi:peptide deformylase